MRDPAHAFRRRFSVLVAALVVAVAGCLTLAVVVARNANGTLRQLADVELEAAMLARQFRAAVDDVHGALLRIGNEPADESAGLIAQRRQRLTKWLRARSAAMHSDEEKQILRRIGAETESYFIKLDGLASRPGGFGAPLDRETVVMFDDSANRLQSMVDELAEAQHDDLRDLLQASLGSVLWLRNLVFACLGLLLVAIGVVVALVYRDVVRPLREQLVQSEALLVKREKLAALGTLAAGVAHEIRNPLTAIKGRLFTLRRSQTSAAGREDEQAISREVDRLERIVRDVLGYARPAESALRALELSAWLREFAAFVRPEIVARQIELSVEATPTANVHADSNQLRQILLNLVRNSLEALEGQPGRITLSLQRERSALLGKICDVAVLTVRDNGPGIPAGIHARLFDPFFTTKPAGTGLGLSIVARLVETQGGEIVFQSAPRVGTRFAVRLPVQTGPTETARP